MVNKDRYQESNRLLKRALKTIPLGSQTFSKSITQFPQGVSPLFITHGQGCHVWDADGNEYIDFMNALLSVTLGYNNIDVTNAVKRQIDNGVSFSLPHPLEMEVAEMLVEMIPCAEMVRFGKNGTDATSAAIRLARAYTDREHIAVCGYHGWQDWYIGSTSRHLGVPTAVRELTHSFIYNDLASVQKLFNKLPKQIAAVIMEPMNVTWPEKGFLENVKKLCHENDALLIFDETITGCRFAKGGAQELFNVIPDLATFGKGLANGFPLSAVVGRNEILRLMEDIFFSGTFAGETASLAAAKVVLTKVRDSDLVERFYSQGKKVLDGISSSIKHHSVEDMIEIGGHPSWTIVTIKDAGPYKSWEIKTLYLQEMFKRGVITIGSHNISYAHTNKDIMLLLDAYDEVLPILKSTVVERNLDSILDAEPLQPLFKVR